MSQIRSPQFIVAGRYRLLCQLGVQAPSAFTQVFLADDLLSGNQVVVKRLAPWLSRADAQLGRACLERERDFLTTLSHPCLPELLQVFPEQDGQSPALILRYVEGYTLDALLSRRRRELRGKQTLTAFPLTFVLPLGIALSELLIVLHERQPPIIHRDLKPANIVLDLQGRVHLLDFGNALPGDFVVRTAFDQRLWKLGSRGYAAPEQYQTGTPTPQTDLYSLGVVLWTLLTAEAPEQRPQAQLFRLAPAGRGPLQPLLASLLQYQPADRPRSAHLVKSQLEALLHQVCAEGDFPSTAWRQEKPLQGEYSPFACL